MPFRYTQYAGSPDIFESSTGRALTENEAKQAGIFTPTGLSTDVEKIATPRPDIKTEADFARLAGTNINVAPLSSSSGTGTFKLDIPTTLDADKIKASFSGGITQADIANLLAELRSREAETAKSLLPTEREKTLQRQLSDIQTATERGQADILGLARPQTLNVGEAAQLERQGLAREAGVQRNLALEQSARGTALEANKALAESTRNQFNLLLQADQALRAKETAIQSVIDKQTDNAKNVLNSIFTTFGGLEWNQLDQNTQSQLTRLANNVGFPIGLIQQGMKTLKERQLQDQAQKQADLQAQRETMNEFRRTQLNISAQNASTLAALRNIQISSQTGVSPGQVTNKATGLPVKLSNEASGKIADYQNLINRTEMVSGLLDEVQNTGAIKGWVYKEGIFFPVVQRELKPKEVELMQELARISNQYVYLVSGKQINEQEFVRLSKAIPDIRATPETNKTVIKNFQSYLESGLNNYLKVNGWDIAGQPQNNNQGLNLNLGDLDFKF